MFGKLKTITLKSTNYITRDATSQLQTRSIVYEKGNEEQNINFINPQHSNL